MRKFLEKETDRELEKKIQRHILGFREQRGLAFKGRRTT